MRNICLKITYEGTRYQGWQRQETSDNTIQGKFEGLLSRMCGEEITIQGSGRTDAGVHAMGQIANFHTHSDMGTEDMLFYMNQYLPEDIAVVEVMEVPERFHSRLNAKGKRYSYRIWNSSIPNVFFRKFAHTVEEQLDLKTMQEAASYLLGEHDFKSFTSTKKGKKSTVRRIDRIDIQKEGDLITFTFEGNGFLYHMIRILVGTLLEVGLGERSADSIPDIMGAKKREMAGMLVPGKGLILEEVYYETK
ncbi:MAG: tRNA pseudouridine(38-40) synthase TruA [Lachnospiraceae bacterium]|nr:tRNA pseudouridine(38-40) synthase TruA [Lachnospiraceae bacterium]